MSPQERDVQPDHADVLDGLVEAGVLSEDQCRAAKALVEDRDRERRHYNADFHPARRARDRLPWWLGAIWRNLVPLLALAMAGYAVGGIQRDVVDAKQLAASQREGRAVAIDVLCGFGNGVEAAGRATLTAPIRPPEFERALERLGLPPKKARSRAQEAAADAYARSISESVAAQVGPRAADRVIARDGSLNCRALRIEARAQKPRGG